FLFSIIVFVILAIVCGSVYYFSYTNRIKTFRTRLSNRAITTARLLSQSDVFSKQDIQEIDSATAVIMRDKTLQAYDFQNNIIYSYSEVPGDTLAIKPGFLDEARSRGEIYFISGNKDAVAYYHVEDNSRILIITAAYDIDGKKKLHQLKLILLFSFIAGILIAFVGGYIFSRQLLYPIKKIADNANEISARNLTRRIHSGRTKDEWFYLTDTLNRLLNRLQESFETQRRFIANASHELNTPLTAITSQLEVYLQRNRDPEDYRKVMQSVYQDARHLSKLTQTLLEFAKASGEPGGLEIDLLRIDEILLRLPAEIKKLDPNYSIVLEFDNLPEQENKLIVLGNVELLFTAIKNIVINACKYSKNHQAHVKLTVQSQKIVIGIQDSGPGINPDKL
ncbi:MAG: HAMP domain-containing histidine kinase, partial [Bacteroidia bacterium]|nr:HAMP domain-containing histidine kinase [Bacteroidia bacterium]